MSLIIINQPAKKAVKEKGKNLVKVILRRHRGPRRVTESLCQGLNELGVAYRFNPSPGTIGVEDTVYVNESPAALREMLIFKKAGKFKRLVAGPAITVLPEDEGGLMLDDNIDVILQPAAWVGRFWQNRAPRIAHKIKIWWAGVDAAAPSAKQGLFLLYVKNAPDRLVNEVKKNLTEKGINYRALVYGHYQSREYYKWLSRASVAIFLSPSESQGLALAEAWARDVPTLVWNRGRWEYGNFGWVDDKISAPYLNEKNGLFFKGVADFSARLDKFLARLNEFQPAEETREKFSHQFCARRFLSLIE